MKFAERSEYTNGASKLAKILVKLSQGNCETTVVGTTTCQLVRQERSSLSSINMVENASVVWEFLKGRKLPGVWALDRVCLYYYSTPYFLIMIQSVLKTSILSNSGHSGAIAVQRIRIRANPYFLQYTF